MQQHASTANPNSTQTNKQAELSVIIPCLNEAESLPQLLEALHSQSDICLQIIVADGGSADNSTAIAERAGATVVSSPAGRGRQMNQAVAMASSPWLLFLHADNQLTHTQQLRAALDCMQAAQQQQAQVAGHFALRFIDRPTQQKRWRILEHKTTLQLPLTINGDQGLLIHRDYFEQLGQFDTTHHFLEDQKLAAKIQQTGRWQLLPHRLQTSARRFQTEGFHQRYWLMTLIMLAWSTGLSRFLNRDNQVYANQSDAKPLTLSAHIQRFLGASNALPLGQQLRLYWSISDLCRSNLYQLFLWIDAPLSRQHWPLTTLWLMSGHRLTQLPLLRQLLQLLLLPVFPIIATSIVLLAKIRH